MSKPKMMHLITQAMEAVENPPDGPGTDRLWQICDEMEKEVWRGKGGLPTMYAKRFIELVESAETRLEPEEYRELVNHINKVSVDKGAEPCPVTTWNKVLDLLQPMREVLNDLEGGALEDERLSAKTLLDLAGKLTAVDLAIMGEYNRELIAESDRLEAERAELMDPSGWAPKKNGREELPEYIQRALNSGDGVYRP